MTRATLAAMGATTTTPRPGPRFQLRGRAHKVALTAHVMSSVGWFGVAVLVAFSAITAASAGDPAYAGPMVLAGAARATEAAADDHHHAASLYSLVDDAQGAWRCHLAFACSDACPSGARPAEQIMRLRRALLARHARHVLRLEAPAEVTT